MAITHWSRDWNLDKLKDGIEGLAAYITELEQKAEAVTGKIMPVKYLGSVMGKRYANLTDYDQNSWHSERKKKRALPLAESHCKELWEQVQKDHEANLVAIENNKKVRRHVMLVMNSIGIPDKTTRKDWGRNRRTPKEVKEEAGYLRDLQEHCPVEDGFGAAEEAHKRFLADIDRLRKEIEAEAREAERIKAQKEKEDAASKLRATLAVKYGLGFDVELREIMHHILLQNKYLRLAHYLRMNRNDWNDGYSYAETGVDGFAVESDQDKAIVENIQAYFPDFEDGRVFRDCEWNYDRLFSLASEQNPELVVDYDLLSQFVY